MIKEQYSIDDFLSLTHRIMHLAFRGLLRVDFLHEASIILLEFAKCDSIEMWLRERGKFYRSEVKHSAKSPFHFEIMPYTIDVRGTAVPKLTRNSPLERICRSVFTGTFDPAWPNFTKKGSFWTGDAAYALASLAEKERGEDSISYVIPDNFRSVAVIPLSVERKNIGLLQLKSSSSDFFSEEELEFFEAVSHSLGIALTHRRAQVELRERVKELMCLFGMAKLAEQPEASLREILQGIVDLLPPAWLFPEIASARITLNGESYTTSLFHESEHKLSAGIVVGGETQGEVEVFYSEEKPELDEGPFLKEERILIDAVAREITLIKLRKQTEEDKARLQEQLQHADRLATIGQLSAGVAHELNEPLGTILGFSQLIHKQADLTDQVKKDIEKIMKASLHAREVIKKLMLFARQTPPKKTCVNVNQVVEEGLYFLESRCTKEGIKLVRSLSKGLPEVTADPSQLTQVLVNIVVNGIQAMPNGGILTIQTEASAECVSLIVKDTGVGMSESVKKKIFLPFYSTKDVGQGTGLGLAVVHGIVTSHRGTILVDSIEGEGTKFEIRLPITGNSVKG
ncbi:MAG: GAF domain-containing protein [Candidatus Aminicenantes bacterium]|nr:GAF domain-containing protein [Candidatus Aminicenantes bacterium]